MSEDAQGGFELRLNNNAYAACVTGLVAALSVAIEMAAFPDHIKVDDVSPSDRLDAIAKEATGRVKNLYAEGMSETDEADGFATAIMLIEDTANRIRKRI